MSHFLKIDITEQLKYEEKRIQTPMNNTINDLHHKLKLENCARNRNYFFIKQNIFFF